MSPDRDDDEEEEDDEEADGLIGNGHASKRAPPPRPPSLLRVLYANVVIFLYTLPINAFSILLLYGVTTMFLSELINTQWDDVIALTLAIVIIPCHMCTWLHHRSAASLVLPRAECGSLMGVGSMARAAQFGASATRRASGSIDVSRARAACRSPSSSSSLCSCSSYTFTSSCSF